jgi:hypothetical protein
MLLVADAEDEADDWWVSWGVTAERMLAVCSPSSGSSLTNFTADFASAVHMSTTIEA